MPDAEHFKNKLQTDKTRIKAIKSGYYAFLKYIKLVNQVEIRISVETVIEYYFSITTFCRYYWLYSHAFTPFKR